MEPAILIISNSHDRSVNLVTTHLDLLGKEYYRLNVDLLTSGSSLTLSLMEDFTVQIRDIETTRISGVGVKSVWWRRPEIPSLSLKLPPDQEEFATTEWQTALWSFYTSFRSAFWVNQPLIGFRLLEHNKLYQMSLAREVGLKIPKSLVTNSFEDLRKFCRSQGGILALKTLKGHFFNSQNTDGTTSLGVIYTNLVSLEQIEESERDIHLCPVLAQEYIEKKIELRVTVVGNEIFSCAINSQDSVRTLHDWRRYDFARVRHESYVLPLEIKEKILLFMKKCEIVFGAIDLIVTPENEYVFLEVNPNGQWSWIESLTGMQISKAIAEILVNPPL